VQVRRRQRQRGPRRVLLQPAAVPLPVRADAAWRYRPAPAARTRGGAVLLRVRHAEPGRRQRRQEQEEEEAPQAVRPVPRLVLPQEEEGAEGRKRRGRRDGQASDGADAGVVNAHAPAGFPRAGQVALAGCDPVHDAAAFSCVDREHQRRELAGSLRPGDCCRRRLGRGSSPRTRCGHRWRCRRSS
jgi:hypothetical protein